ncbi:MAG: hypothetical protein Q4G68_05195 [Planctomycetia bacterium]|nr:hypothetical protein [Planctomycetia bacterium]
MKKTDLERLISLYIDGELDPRQSVAVSNLIQSNSEAARVYREYNEMRDMFGALRPMRAPDGFRERVVTAVKRRFPGGRPVVVPAEGYALRGRRLIIAIISGATAVCLIAFACAWMVMSGQPDSVTRVVARVVVPERPSAARSVEGPAPVAAPDPVEEPFIRTPPVPLSLTPNKVDEPVLSPAIQPLRVRLVLKEEKKDRFSGRLLKVCSERELSFQKGHNQGQLEYVFRLSPAEYEQLVRWLEKQTDLVTSLTLPEGTVSNLSESEMMTVTFEVAP